MEIKPYSKNAKKHPQSQLVAIAKSIKEFGWQQPIVVDKHGVIIAGHGRFLAYTEFKDDLNLPEPKIEVANLTEQQAKAYRLADNKLNESDWDLALVIEDFKELDDLQELTGFDKSIMNMNFEFKNTELSDEDIDEKQSNHKGKACPNCGEIF